MKTIFVSNGKVSLVLVPETDLEKQQLNELFKQPVEVTVHEKLQVIDKAFQNAAVITPKVQTA